MATKLTINTNTKDNIPDEKKGNSSLGNKTPHRNSNDNNKRAVGPERELKVTFNR